MKIRTGFVSNSSSSSFCILGVCLNYDDFKKDNFDVYELEDLIGNKIDVHHPDGCDGVYIGLGCQKIGEDETARAFKERIYSMIAPVLKKEFNINIKLKDIQNYSETYYC